MFSQVCFPIESWGIVLTSKIPLKNTKSLKNQTPLSLKQQKGVKIKKKKKNR